MGCMVRWKLISYGSDSFHLENQACDPVLAKFTINARTEIALM